MDRIFREFKVDQIFGKSTKYLDILKSTKFSANLNSTENLTRNRKDSFQFENCMSNANNLGQTDRLSVTIYLGMTAIYRHFPLNYNSKNQHKIKYSKPNLE